MIEHSAATDGEAAPATTENNSTPSTQDSLLTNSPSTRWIKPPDGVIIAPNGTIMKRGRGRPRNNQRADPKQVHRYYNLQFRGGRRYKLLITSMSEPSVLIEKDVMVKGLRKLMLAVAHEIGAHRQAKAVNHFTVTLKAYPDEQAQLMQTEQVEVKEVNGTLQDEAPATYADVHSAIDAGLEI